MLKFTNGNFFLNANKINIYCGALHYFRIFPELWRDRLEKLKNIGFNTVETYCAWNLHEEKEGVFNFEGMLDVAEFIKVATELGLWVIVRPGPYICSECDFGGLPAWLLKNDSVKIRSNDPFYLEKAKIYLEKVIDEIRPHFSSNGGNVIAVSVENEYGSFGNSTRYMDMCAEMLLDLNVDIPLITTDGFTRQLIESGSTRHALPCLNFGKAGAILESHIAPLKELYPDAPVFHSEHWVGYNSHWGYKKNTYPTELVAKEVKEQLEKDMSFSFYMFHGGTNFGFFNGANIDFYFDSDKTRSIYKQTVTSYDVDAPLSEWGECGEKYLAVQKIMEEHLNTKLPRPKKVPVQNIGKVELCESTSLFENLDNISKCTHSMIARNMEYYDQNFGYILYRTSIKPQHKISTLFFIDVFDRFHVYFNRQHIATLHRNDEKQHVDVPYLMDEGGVLEILVENTGRVNYGPQMITGERKGICGMVGVVGDEGARQMLCEWDVYPLPMKNLENLDFSRPLNRTPAFFKGTFKAEQGKDCFIHTENFTKGFIFVNGFNLGRFWNIGPQKSLYLPHPLLKEENEIILFEEEALCGEPYVEIKDYHTLDGNI